MARSRMRRARRTTRHRWGGARGGDRGPRRRDPRGVLDQARQAGRERGGPEIRYAQPDQLIGSRRKVPLHLGPLGEDPLPVFDPWTAIEQIAQLGAAIRGEEPATIGVDCQRLLDPGRLPPDQSLEETRFVGVARATGLEPDRPGVRRHDHRGPPWPEARLLDRARDADSLVVELVLDPGERRGAPRSAAERHSGSSHLVRAVFVWRPASATAAVSSSVKPRGPSGSCRGP